MNTVLCVVCQEMLWLLYIQLCKISKYFCQSMVYKLQKLPKARCFLSTIIPKIFTILTCLYIWVTWLVSYKKQELLTLCEHPSSSPFFLWGVLLIFLLFCVVLLCGFCVLMSSWKWRCLVHLCLQLFVGWLMSDLRYLCLFVHSNIQHILCCVFVCFTSSYCQFLWIVHFWLPLLYYLKFTFISQDLSYTSTYQAGHWCIYYSYQFRNFQILYLTCICLQIKNEQISYSSPSPLF